MATGTINNFVERAFRLYEQEPGDLSRASRFGAYVRRWKTWSLGGLGELPSEGLDISAERCAGYGTLRLLLCREPGASECEERSKTKQK